MRKPTDMSQFYDDQDTDGAAQSQDKETNNLLTFPLRLASSDDDDYQSNAKASAYDIAEYIAEMLEPLENLALQNRLEVLGLMIAMAREQANDDVRENGTT